jgi:hypothetical protein
MGITLTQEALPFCSVNIGKNPGGGIYETELRHGGLFRPYIWDCEFYLFLKNGEMELIGHMKLIEAEVKRRIRKEPVVEMDLRKDL